MFSRQLRLFSFISLICVHLFILSLADGHPTKEFSDSYREPTELSTPTNTQDWQGNTETLQSRASHRCGFVGNNDIYGVGIRIGIYSQTLAIWFAKYFSLSQAPFLRDTVTVFTVALFVVSIIYAANASQTYAVEAFILLLVLQWSCLTGVRAQTTYSKEKFHNSAARRVLTESMDLGSIGLSIWFTFHGLDEMMKTPCGTFAFFVVKVHMFGWYRTLMKIMPILALVNHVCRAPTDMAEMWHYRVLHKSTPSVVETTNRYEALERRSAGKGSSSALSLHRRATLVNVGDSDQNSTSEELNRSESQGKNSTTAPSARRMSQSSEMTLSPIRSQTQKQDEDIEEAPQDEDWGVFEDVYQGEIFLARCLAAANSHRLDHHRSRLYKLLMLLIQNPRPSTEKSPNFQLQEDVPLTLPSYFKCFFHVYKALVTFRFTSGAMTLYTYLFRLGIIDPWNGPLQVYTALTYPEPLPRGVHAPIPSASGTAVASTIMEAKTRRNRKPMQSWIIMTSELFIHIFIILQLELTIRWNSIEGLVGLASVGQLIPFVIGVGSLGLVLVRWIQLKYGCRKGDKESVEKSMEGHGDDDDNESKLHERIDAHVLAVYGRWKERFEADLNNREETSEDLAGEET